MSGAGALGDGNDVMCLADLLSHRQFWEHSVTDFGLLVFKVFIETQNHGLTGLNRTLDIS